MDKIIDYRGGKYTIGFIGRREVAFFWCDWRKERVRSNIDPSELRNPALKSDRPKDKYNYPEAARLGNYDR